MLRLEPLLDDSGRVMQWYGINTDIEDLKRTEAKLRRDEEELRRIVDAIPQTIVALSPEGRAVYANRMTLEYTGSRSMRSRPRTSGRVSFIPRMCLGWRRSVGTPSHSAS